MYISISMRMYMKCYNLKMLISPFKIEYCRIKSNLRTKIDNVLDFKSYNSSINSNNYTRSVLPNLKIAHVGRGSLERENK